MDQELVNLDEQMKSELQSIKDKYASLKKGVKAKYKKIEQDQKKEQKRLEKEELKKTRKSIPKSLKNLVWNKCIGKEKGLGECDVCKCEIDSKNFDCGHIISVKEGGDTNESNLVPLCSPCNKSMGAQNLTEFKEKYFKSNKPTYESLEHEYVETLISESDSFISINDINDYYMSWIKQYHPDQYDELSKGRTDRDCMDAMGLSFYDKNDKMISSFPELEKYLIQRFKEPQQSLQNIKTISNTSFWGGPPQQQQQHCQGNVYSNGPDVTYVKGYNVTCN